MADTDVAPPTDRTRVRRLANRGHYDRETINAIIDDAIVCHVGFNLDGRPAVLPTAHWREGDHLVIHGNSKSQMLRTLRDGTDCCVTVTHLDGIVLARSMFHHSVNYRSVVIYGQMSEITEPAAKMRSLEYFMERIAPGRWTEARQPDTQELKATMVLQLPLSEASAKIRSGPPVDDDIDMKQDVWAGIVPVRMVASEPVTAADMQLDKAVPDHARHLFQE